MWNTEASPKYDGRQQLQNPAPVAAGRQSSGPPVMAWVGKSVVFKGDLTSSEDMMIDGRVEGSIQIRDHTLTVGPDADIRANILARAVTVNGAVTGTITARDKVDIRQTGSVEGDIFSPRLAIADGALLRGRVDTEAGGSDQKERRPGATSH